MKHLLAVTLLLAVIFAQTNAKKLHPVVSELQNTHVKAKSVEQFVEDAQINKHEAQCYHADMAEVQEKEISRLPLEEITQMKKYKNVESKAWNNVRIELDTDQIISHKNLIKKQLLPKVQDYFQNTLKVHSLQKPLVVSEVYSQHKCTCGSNAIPTNGSGYNADVLIVVSTFDDAKAPFLATATRCSQFNRELDSLRTQIISLTINTSKFTEKISLQDQYEAIVKEINFALQLSHKKANKWFQRHFTSKFSEIDYNEKDICSPLYDIEAHHTCTKVFDYSSWSYKCAEEVCADGYKKKFVWSAAAYQCCSSKHCCGLYKFADKKGKCICLKSGNFVQNANDIKGKCISPVKLGYNGWCRSQDSYQYNKDDRTPNCCNKYGCCPLRYTYSTADHWCFCLPGYEWNADAKECQIRQVFCLKGDTQDVDEDGVATCSNDYGTCEEYQTADTDGACKCLNGYHFDAQNEEGPCITPPNNGGNGSCLAGDSKQTDPADAVACCNATGCCQEFETNVKGECICQSGYYRDADSGDCVQKPKVNVCLASDIQKQNDDGSYHCCNSHGCCAAYATRDSYSGGYCYCIWGRHADASDSFGPCIQPPNSGNDQTCDAGASLQNYGNTNYCCNSFGCCYENRTLEKGTKCHCRTGYYFNKTQNKCVETGKPPKVCVKTDTVDGPDAYGKYQCTNDNGSCPPYKTANADGNCVCIWNYHFDALNTDGSCILPPNLADTGDVCEVGMSSQKNAYGKIACCNGVGCCSKYKTLDSYGGDCTCMDNYQVSADDDSKCEKIPEDPVVCLDSDTQTKDANGVFHCSNDYGVCSAYKTHQETTGKCECIWGRHFEAANHHGPCINPPNTDGQGKCGTEDVSYQRNQRNHSKCCNKYGCCGKHSWDDEEHHCECDDGYVRHNKRHKCVLPGEEND